MIHRAKKRSISGVLPKLVFAASTYFIWQERNLCIFQKKNSKGVFDFTFNSKDRIDAMLESGMWLIRNVPLILKKWSPNANIMKEDVCNVPVWIKLHDIPFTAFTEDGLSAIATKLGYTLMLDSYTSTMCMES